MSSTTTRAGLIIAGLLGVADLAMLGSIGADGGPPVVVIALSAVLGVITLGAVAPAWRGSRPAAIAITATRSLSALTAVPAFFVEEASSGFVALAAVLVVLTIAAIALLVPAIRATTPAAA